MGPAHGRGHQVEHRGGDQRGGRGVLGRASARSDRATAFDDTLGTCATSKTSPRRTASRCATHCNCHPRLRRQGRSLFDSRQDRRVPVQKAFAVPVLYYVQFMERTGCTNGRRCSPTRPSRRPGSARPRCGSSAGDDRRRSIDGFQQLLREKMAKDFPGMSCAFAPAPTAKTWRLPLRRLLRIAHGRPGRLGRRAGCDPRDLVEHLAVPHLRGAQLLRHRPPSVGMALLVTTTFPTRRPTASPSPPTPSIPSGLEPGFYVNVQYGGDAEVVHPPPGVTSDQLHPPLPTGAARRLPVPLEPIVTANGADSRATPRTGQGARRHPHALLACLRPRGRQPRLVRDGRRVQVRRRRHPGRAAVVIKQARPYPGRGQYPRLHRA